jgi:AraC-like DNA-binding protein
MAWTILKADDKIGLRGFFSFFETEKDCGFFFPGEVHNFWECLYIRSGRASVFADGRIYDISDGTMVFHKPMELHKYRVTSPEGAEIFTFSFCAYGELMSFFENKVFALTESQRALLCSAFDHLRQAYPKAQKNSTGSIFYSYHAASDTLPVQMLAHYVSLLLLSISEDAAVCEDFEPEDLRIFKRAVDYMSANLSRRLTVTDVASACGISVSGLKSLFSSQLGIGVHKYLLTLRIKKAAELLQSGVSVSETADRLGFCDQGYFSAAFKRETGYPPSHFKLQHSEDLTHSDR